MVGLGLLSLAGNTDFEAWSVASFVLIGVGLIPLSALFAQRAHDIGLSAFVPLSLFLVLAAPMLTVMDYEPGVFGRALARAAYEAGLDAVTLYPFVIIGNGLWMAFAIFMIVKKGQPNANRFGLPPALTSD